MTDKAALSKHRAAKMTAATYASVHVRCANKDANCFIEMRRLNDYMFSCNKMLHERMKIQYITTSYYQVYIQNILLVYGADHRIYNHVIDKPCILFITVTTHLPRSLSATDS